MDGEGTIFLLSENRSSGRSLPRAAARKERRNKAVYTTAPVAGGWAGAVMVHAGAIMILIGAVMIWAGHAQMQTSNP